MIKNSLARFCSISIIAMLALVVAVGCAAPPIPAIPTIPVPETTPGETGKPTAEPTPIAVDAIDITEPIELTLWNQASSDFDRILQQAISEFTALNPNIKITIQGFPDYNVLYGKVLGSIQAGSQPNIVAAYENQAADYYESGALIPLDNYIQSKRYGLTAAEIADYIPSYMEATRFPQYGGKTLTFPYTKSDLLLYTNMDVLRSLGYTQPPITWTEFLQMCRSAVAAGRGCYAMEPDASTFDGIIFSYGGDLVTADGTKSRFETLPATQTFTLYETLARQGLAYQVRGSSASEAELVAGRALFIMRSSTSVPRLTTKFANDSSWEVSIIPQGTTTKKVTVLFGANIAVMKSTPQKQLASWLFIKYFSSPDVTARWGLDPGNGYFPLRQSAIDKPSSAQILRSSPRFKEAMDISKFGKVEPSSIGWQQVRLSIQEAIVDIFSGRETAVTAQKILTEKANKVLSQQ